LILARMKLECIVEDRASIEGQSLQPLAEAAYPLIDVVGAGFDQTVRVEVRECVRARPFRAASATSRSGSSRRGWSR